MGAVRFLLLALLLFATIPAHAADFYTVRVISVADGDMNTVLTANKQQAKIRLYGIDCPATGQEYVHRARAATRFAVAGKDVNVRLMDDGRQGQFAAVVEIPDVSVSLNAFLVLEGLAWVNPQLCTDEDICGPLREKEQEAREQKKGLWAGKNPVPPWEWLRNKK